eukprot:301055-Karenia_brevis.AAC.1
MYIGNLRQRLEAAHPRLCRMAHVTIALLLYADDAALPAETEEDLQLSASIFEDFCNDHELFIAVPKTYVTVFHAQSDNNVKYHNNKVKVDGREVVITIYNQQVSATREF